VNVAAETGEGVYTIDAETEQVVDFVPGAELSETPQPRVELPLFVAAAAEGSTVVAVLDRRRHLLLEGAPVLGVDRQRLVGLHGVGLEGGVGPGGLDEQDPHAVFADLMVQGFGVALDRVLLRIPGP